ncbi:hypothetical protein NC796_22605 [Aliifodinibius sp. S!AR15-10]|uniref:hypothetical protein n=1 Tax=Aliifodinibius sp. S!AR15-10 TaxID=2950437 RepID=UPI00286695F8|nr:hypothetical protein [Aliifodinibius sp. S!AR15-10]MDR8393963.1 hypothetical protein [Aliifodinibius sp. S!AR15-10]
MRIKITYWILVLFFGISCTRIVDSVEQKSSSWNEYESEHYIFYVREGSQAEESIEAIKVEQERAYRELNERLGLTFDRKLLVYVYESRQDFGETVRTGRAHPELGMIETIYGSDAKTIGMRGISLHELSHIVAFYEWCPVTERLFSEGLAVWLDDYWRAPSITSTDLFQISKVLLRRGQLPSVEDMITQWDELESQHSYPAAGAFTKFLIREYGLDSFKRLYCEARTRNFDSVFFDIYGKRFWEIEEVYHSFLRNY